VQQSSLTAGLLVHLLTSVGCVLRLLNGSLALNVLCHVWLLLSCCRIRSVWMAALRGNNANLRHMLSNLCDPGQSVPYRFNEEHCRCAWHRLFLLVISAIVRMRCACGGCWSAVHVRWAAMSNLPEGFAFSRVQAPLAQWLALHLTFDRCTYT
jgi:hypothetical protein